MADTRPHTFTADGARRIANAVRAYEGGDPPGRRKGRVGPGGNNPVWAKITSSSSLGAGKWEYTVKIMIGGDASAHSGLREYSSDTWKAYNVAEELSNTGYVNSGVSGILAIPNNSLVLCTWSNRNAATVLLFRDRNEPTCT